MSTPRHDKRSHKTCGFALSEGEIAAIKDLATAKGVSKTAIVRQALRLYQMIEVRISRGERLFFENDIRKAEINIVL